MFTTLHVNLQATSAEPKRSTRKIILKCVAIGMDYDQGARNISDVGSGPAELAEPPTTEASSMESPSTHLNITNRTNLRVSIDAFGG